jgi:hypothetical protein
LGGSWISLASAVGPLQRTERGVAANLFFGTRPGFPCKPVGRQPPHPHSSSKARQISGNCSHINAAAPGPGSGGAAGPAGGCSGVCCARGCCGGPRQRGLGAAAGRCGGWCAAAAAAGGRCGAQGRVGLGLAWACLAARPPMQRVRPAVEIALAPPTVHIHRPPRAPLLAVEPRPQAPPP